MYTDKSFKCGHCSNSSVMSILSEGWESDVYSEVGSHYLIMRCPSCKDLNVVQQDYLEEEDYGLPSSPIMRKYYKEIVYLYPNQRRIFLHLPLSVERAYTVALKTYHIEPIAFAVLVGRTLEFMCKDRQAKGKDLHSMLKDLVERGEIPLIIENIAQGLRFFRNVSAHASELEVSQEDAIVLRDMCETILEYVYEAPTMLKNFEERIEQLKSNKELDCCVLPVPTHRARLDGQQPHDHAKVRSDATPDCGPGTACDGACGCLPRPV